MPNLEFKFIEEDKRKEVEFDFLEQELHRIGKAISEYAKGDFFYLVSSSSKDYKKNSVTLYIMIPALGYDYRILSLYKEPNNHVNIKFHTLDADYTEGKKVPYNKETVSKVINEFIYGEKANSAFKFLIGLIENKKSKDKTEKSLFLDFRNALTKNPIENPHRWKQVETIFKPIANQHGFENVNIEHKKERHFEFYNSKKDTNSLLIAFKYHRTPAGGGPQTTPINAGNIFKDIYNLKFNHQRNLKKWLVYLTDTEMEGYLTNNLNDFFNCPLNKIFEIPLGFNQERPPVFLEQIPEPKKLEQIKLVCIASFNNINITTVNEEKKKHALRIYEILND